MEHLLWKKKRRIQQVSFVYLFVWLFWLICLFSESLFPNQPKDCTSCLRLTFCNTSNRASRKTQIDLCGQDKAATEELKKILISAINLRIESNYEYDTSAQPLGVGKTHLFVVAWLFWCLWLLIEMMKNKLVRVSECFDTMNSTNLTTSDLNLLSLCLVCFVSISFTILTSLTHFVVQVVMQELFVLSTNIFEVLWWVNQTPSIPFTLRMISPVIKVTTIWLTLQHTPLTLILVKLLWS